MIEEDKKMKILDYKENPKPGFMQGTASIEFQSPWGMMEIHNIAIFQKNGSRWVNLPQRPTGTKNERGFNNYTSLVNFRDEYEKDLFHKQFFPLLDAFIVAKQGPSVHAQAAVIHEDWKQRKEVPF